MDHVSAYVFITNKLVFGEYSAEELDAYLDFLGSISEEEANVLLDVHWSVLKKRPSDESYLGPNFMDRLATLLPLDESELAEGLLMDSAPFVMGSGKRNGARHMIGRYWKAIAACVLLAVGIGMYVASRRKEVNKAAVVIAKEMQQPPLTGNHNLLTLADGRIIELDTAKEGVLAYTGNTTLILEHGQLVCRKTQGSIAYGHIEGRYHTLVTARGARFGVILEDSSQIVLNTASTLKIPVPEEGGKMSRMVVLAGEAYFDIRHDADHPFVVKVNNSAFTDLGTRFNIMAYDDEDMIKATVFQGAVRLNKDTVNRRLTKGEQAQISNISSGIHVVKGIDENGVIAWKKGYFHFYNADLRTVIRQLARWYDMQVLYDEGVGQEFHLYTGDIPQRLPAKVVLENIIGKNVTCIIENRTIHIKRK
jgi:ferric-dicitrate binding protein FerR (iron transport regulator)